MDNGKIDVDKGNVERAQKAASLESDGDSILLDSHHSPEINSESIHEAGATVRSRLFNIFSGISRSFQRVFGWGNDSVSIERSTSSIEIRDIVKENVVEEPNNLDQGDGSIGIERSSSSIEMKSDVEESVSSDLTKLDPMEQFFEQFNIANDNRELFLDAVTKKCEEKFAEGKFSQQTLGAIVIEAFITAETQVQQALQDVIEEINQKGYEVISSKLSKRLKLIVGGFKAVDKDIKGFIRRIKCSTEMSDRLVHLPDGYTFSGKTHDDVKANFKAQLNASLNKLGIDGKILDRDSSHASVIEALDMHLKEDSTHRSFVYQCRAALDLYRTLSSNAVFVDKVLEFIESKGDDGSHFLCEALSHLGDFLMDGFLGDMSQVDLQSVEDQVINYVFDFKTSQHNSKEFGKPFNESLIKDKKWGAFNDAWNQFHALIKNNSSISENVKSKCLKKIENYVHEASIKRQEVIKLKHEAELKSELREARPERTIQRRFTFMERIFRSILDRWQSNFNQSAYLRRKIIKLQNDVLEFKGYFQTQGKVIRPEDVQKKIDDIEKQVNKYVRKVPRLTEQLRQQNEALKSELNRMIGVGNIELMFVDTADKESESEIVLEGNTVRFEKDSFATGGEGSVHKGIMETKNKGHHRVVVKKVSLLWDEYTSGVKAQTYLREAYANQKIPGHPNVLPVYHSSIIQETRGREVAEDGTVTEEGINQDILILVMPEANQDACDHVREAEDESPDYKAHQLEVFALPVLSGLQHLNKNGFAHRDIKPGNIFIDHDGNVRLGDLGTACELSDKEGMSQVEGTPEFMSPECARAELYTDKSDVFSVGAIMFQMMTGKTLYSASYSEGELNSHDRWAANRFQREFSSEHLDRCLDHPGLMGLSHMKEFLKRCLEPDQNKRASATELIDWIEHLKS